MDDIIEQSIFDTLKEHPNFSNKLSQILYYNSLEINLRNFTSKNNARGNMMYVTSNDILKYNIHIFLKGYNVYLKYLSILDGLSISNQMKKNILSKKFVRYGEYNHLYNIIMNNNINVKIYLLGDLNNLSLLTNIVHEMIINRINDQKMDSYFRIYGDISNELSNKIETDFNRCKNISYCSVNNKAFNKCSEDINKGIQLKNKHNVYKLDGTVFAEQDVGLKRNNQEDSVLIASHPANHDFKFMAVSDGMGGSLYGEIASSYVVKSLLKWFETLPSNYFYDKDKFSKLYNEIVNEISLNLFESFNFNKTLRAGATLTSAVVLNDCTIISSVGDSRVYVVSNGDVHLVTKDESLVWFQYACQTGRGQFTTDEVEKLKFKNNNNQIYRCVGDKSLGGIQTVILGNSDYDRLVIMSDGVSDLLSEEKIKFYSGNIPLSKLSNKLISMAISYDNYSRDNNSDIKVVPAGKDNASVIVFGRR